MAQSGLVTPGNIDLTNRPRVTNPDGSISTVRSISFGQDGKEILVPTVVDGRVVSDAEAIAHYRKTGQHLGIFTTPSAATAFAQRLHESEAGKLMPDTSTVVIVDDEGTEHQFPAGFDPKRAAQIVKNQRLTAANERPLQEPTTFGGGFAKGLNDYATELGQNAFESAAQPRTAGDFLSLVGPSILPMRATAGMKVIPGSAEPMGNRAIRFGSRRAADVLDITPNILTNKLEDRAIKGLRSFGEREPPRFTDLPLSKQQRYLPQTPGPERRSVPPTQAEPTPFHERPLFQQQESLPERPAPDVRTPMPSHVPQGTMNDLPLYKQQEILEKFGAKTGAGSIRSGQEPPQAGGRSFPASPSPLGARVPVEGMVGEGSSAPAASLSPMASHLQPTSPIARSFQEGLRPLIETDEIPHGLVPHSFHQTIGDLNQGMRAGQPGPLDELLLKILREGK